MKKWVVLLVGSIATISVAIALPGCKKGEEPKKEAMQQLMSGGS